MKWMILATSRPWAKLIGDVSVQPNSSLPITQTVSNLVGGLETLALFACVGAIIVGAALWAAGNRSGNFSGAHNGRQMVFYGVIGAMVIGGASALVNWATGIGAGIP
jgi:hypothetical protein